MGQTCGIAIRTSHLAHPETSLGYDSRCLSNDSMKTNTVHKKDKR